MARRVGRPKKPDEEKKRVVSISLDKTDIVILDTLCMYQDVTRSQMVRQLLRDAGLKEHGIVGLEIHATQFQEYVLPKTGLKACNPYVLQGKCTHSACRYAYEKEGL